MIVDLLRNDLGRVARARLGRVERRVRSRAVRDRVAAHVVGHLAGCAPDVGLADVFAALFPCGSVTGAPKVRTMHLIAELEDSPRGVYCGAVGYPLAAGVGPPTARFDVPIRTVIVDAETRHGRVRRGRRDHVGLPRGRASTTRRWPRRGCWSSDGRDSSSTRRSSTSPDARVPPPRPPPGAVAWLGDYFGFAVRRGGASRPRAETELASTTGRAGPRPLVDRRGRVLGEGYRLPPARRSPSRSPRPGRAVDPSDPMVFHKTTRRRRYDEAKARHPDADDVVLSNTRGEITETTIANIAVQLEGRWVDPCPRCGAPARRRARDGARGGAGRGATDHGGGAPRRPSEVALVSDNRGWRRVRLVDVSQSAGFPLGNDVRGHRGLVQRTGTQWASGRILVDEHGALAERASSLLHRGRLSGLVRHVGDRARGERSPATVHRPADQSPPCTLPRRPRRRPAGNGT